MKYRLPDVLYKPLKDELKLRVLAEVERVFGIEFPVCIPSDYEAYMLKIIDKIKRRQLTKSFRYIMSKTARDRAIAVYDNKLSKENEAKLVAIWQKYADQMSRLEKVLRGWYD